MSDQPKVTDLRANVKAKLIAEFGVSSMDEIRTQWQNATTVAALKPIIAKMFKVIIDL